MKKLNSRFIIKVLLVILILATSLVVSADGSPKVTTTSPTYSLRTGGHHSVIEYQRYHNGMVKEPTSETEWRNICGLKEDKDHDHKDSCEG